jgi:hypothetical protein
MNRRLRLIPDTCDEFIGFQKGMDVLGGDFAGYGQANNYRSTGQASVRNVRLPTAGSHSAIPYVRPLLGKPAAVQWIGSYRPEGDGTTPPSMPDFGGKSAKVLWAAEVWHAIKKHWVLELQRLIRARGTHSRAGSLAEPHPAN